jgi:hypothetical protein
MCEWNEGELVVCTPTSDLFPCPLITPVCALYLICFQVVQLVVLSIYSHLSLNVMEMRVVY